MCIKITRIGTAVPLYELAAKQMRKEHKLVVEIFCENEVQVGMALKKVQKQGRNENARRLSCCRKVVVKKDWKATLLLLPDKACGSYIQIFTQKTAVSDIDAV